ncbi:MAG TPA: NAD(P)-dependent alcohol dehydrogenase [Gemmatimonadaceae bacterium]|nr:NAD(P)-dependent alcohol dehydrogenase [Gemmatimonadaceae bacterium]
MMRAIVQKGYGSPDVLKLEEIERPAVADNGVLIRVRAASVNAMDSHMVHSSRVFGMLMGLRTKRRVRGVDVAGVVEAVGKDVTRFKPGDEVFGFANGAFADYASTSEDRLAIKPRNLSFAEAAATPMAAITALQGLRDTARVQRGQRVLIHGAGGGVGSFAVQIAKALGAHVTAVTSTRNMNVVSALAPDDTIDYTREDFAKRAERFDVVFDNAATRPVRDCLRVLTPTGIYAGVGAPKSGTLAAIRHLGEVFVRSRFTRRVRMVMAKAKREDLETLREMAEAGSIRPVIDNRYSLAQVPDAIRYVKAGQGRAKVVIDIDT